MNSPVRLTEIQTIMGRGKATAIRWQRFLTGFRMLLFSAKEIVNEDNKSGVTNTYHLMLLFDRLHKEAVGRESEADKMFSKGKVRISDPAQSA